MLEPREHLVPDPAFRGHFNLLRAYVAPLGVAGVKVVGDYIDNYKLGLPSELALLTLYDPRTGVPLAIVDATEITDWRTGAVTAIGARHLARRGSKVLGHIGARGTAFSNVTMLDSEFDFEEIRVTSRRRESREAFGATAEGRARQAGTGRRLGGAGDPRGGHRGRGHAPGRARAARAHALDRAGRPRGAVRDRQRRGAVAHRDHGQDRRRRLAAVPAGALRVAAAACRARPAERGEPARRARADRRRDQEAAASATTSASCSGTGGSQRPTWPSGNCSTSAPSRPGSARCCITVDAVIVLERHDQLDLDGYRRVVRDHEPVEIEAELLRRVGERRRAMDEHLAAGGVAYGVTTGLGYLARSPVGGRGPACPAASDPGGKGRGRGGAAARGRRARRDPAAADGLPQRPRRRDPGALSSDRRPAERRLVSGGAVQPAGHRGRDDRALSPVPDLHRRGRGARDGRARAGGRGARPPRRSSLPAATEGGARVDQRRAAGAGARGVAGPARGGAARPCDPAGSPRRRAGGRARLVPTHLASGGSRAIRARRGCTPGWPVGGATHHLGTARRRPSPCAFCRRSTGPHTTSSTTSCINWSAS